MRPSPPAPAIVWILAAATVGTVVLTAPALAARVQPVPPGAPAAATDGGAPEAAKSPLTELKGRFQWGLAPDQVQEILIGDLHKLYDEQIQETPDPSAQDRVRRERDEAIAQVKRSGVEFDGQRSGWDVSLIDREFDHATGESMLVQWEKDQRRFFFFVDGKLWKQYIALNAEKYPDKTFADFALLMQERFGPARPVFHTTLKGEKVLAYLEWPPAAGDVLRAVDQTGFYGNFCLVILDQTAAELLAQRRKAAHPVPEISDPVVHGATQPASHDTDVNADVVDRITGKSSSPPPLDDGLRGQSRTPPRSRPRRY